MFLALVQVINFNADPAGKPVSGYQCAIKTKAWCDWQAFRGVNEQMGLGCMQL
jgi:hypothetical protein